ncbi:MAG: hypothetical protein Q8R47_04300 [Nanoarchaeota archaeon]|nr:hypothetical protein [Nanoarchaeota archaeon]
MKKKVLMVLGLFAVALLAVSLSGKITGNAFAYNLPRSCTESDGGNNPYELGTVEYKDTSFAGPKRTAADACLNNGNLFEHYCDGPVHLTETIPCRCEEGACKK